MRRHARLTGHGESELPADETLASLDPVECTLSERCMPTLVRTFGVSICRYEGMMNVKIKYKVIDPSKPFRSPTRGSALAGCWDLYASDFGYITPGQKRYVGLNVAIELPPGYKLRIRSRSSMDKADVAVHAATIDADYRGEVFVGLRNLGERVYIFGAGDRIAQCEVIETIEQDWEEGELSETVRGQGGFGSTGR